ncbi:MAG: hypothetical protein ACREBC_11230 [Pyrinomonadaceae bacterium]
MEEPAAFAWLPLIGEAELKAMRAGVSVSGLDISIGTNIRTLLDGQVALESSISLSETGLMTQTVLSPSDGTPLQEGLTLVLGDGSGKKLNELTPATVDLPGLEGSIGVVLYDAKGFTAVLHQINANQILSALINQASGRHISHEVNVDVTVANFRQFQQAVQNATLAARLTDLLN